jgi:hypothetical protein
MNISKGRTRKIKKTVEAAYLYLNFTEQRIKAAIGALWSLRRVGKREQSFWRACRRQEDIDQGCAEFAQGVGTIFPKARSGTRRSALRG